MRVLGWIVIGFLRAFSLHIVAPDRTVANLIQFHLNMQVVSRFYSANEAFLHQSSWMWSISSVFQKKHS